VYVYMLMFYHQTVGQNRFIRVADRSFENVAKFGNDGNTLEWYL
jgi:hypothetical protein